MVVGHVSGISADKTRYDYAKCGITRWRTKVGAVPLRLITPTAAEDWKLSYLAKAGENPQRIASVRRSFNAVLRHCKSLFSQKIISKPNFGITLPRFPIRDPQRGQREVFWFETLTFEKNGSMKFRAPAGVSYDSLLRAAQTELRPDSPDAYLLLLLCLCAGLRRAEADNLLWSQILEEHPKRMLGRLVRPPPGVPLHPKAAVDLKCPRPVGLDPFQRTGPLPIRTATA